jgi:hypothetical protein
LNHRLLRAFIGWANRIGLFKRSIPLLTSVTYDFKRILRVVFFIVVLVHRDLALGVVHVTLDGSVTQLSPLSRERRSELADRISHWKVFLLSELARRSA